MSGDSSVPQEGRREERKAQNRAKLLAAARKVFAEKGLGEATVRDIVRATDLATGTFYNYFRDKEEVFAALLQEFERRVADATLPSRRDMSLTIEQRIEQGALAFFQVVAEDAELFNVLRRNVGSVAIPTESMFAEGMADLAEDLDRWSRAGDIGEANLDYLGAAIAGASFQIAIRMVERDRPDPEEAARFTSAAVLGLIRALAGDPATAGG